MRRSLSGGARGRASTDPDLTPARLEGGDGINCGGSRWYRASASRARLRLAPTLLQRKWAPREVTVMWYAGCPVVVGPGEADEEARIHYPYAESAAE